MKHWREGMKTPEELAALEAQKTAYAGRDHPDERVWAANRARIRAARGLPPYVEPSDRAIADDGRES